MGLRPTLECIRRQDSGASLVVFNGLAGIGGDSLSNLIREFILKRFTAHVARGRTAIYRGCAEEVLFKESEISVTARSGSHGGSWSGISADRQSERNRTGLCSGSLRERGISVRGMVANSAQQTQRGLKCFSLTAISLAPYRTQCGQDQFAELIINLFRRQEHFFVQPPIQDENKR